MNANYGNIQHDKMKAKKAVMKDKFPGKKKKKGNTKRVKN